MYVLGLQSAEIYDQLIFTVLDAATNVYRPNNKTADTGLVAGDVPSFNDLIELDALLNSQGARQFADGEYAFVTSPQPFAALVKDPDFKASHQLVQPEAIWRAQVGMLGGFSVVRSNAPGIATATAQAGAGQSSKVYSSFALGRMAYQISDLQNLRVYVVAPGGQSDPLQQNRKIGWKMAFKSVITNQTWIRRVRTSGLDSVTNP